MSSLNIDAIDCLDNWPKPRRVGSALVCTTQCMYPSQSLVDVAIETGKEVALVSDRMGALKQVSAFSASEHESLKILRNAAKRFGVQMSTEGALYLSNISCQHLPAAISIVANASAAAASDLVSKIKVEKTYDFRVELDQFLTRTFDSAVTRKAMLPGHSNKLHKFGYLIRLKQDFILVIDPVLPDQSSINATLVPHLDLKQAKNPEYVQRIVYDDREEWEAEDLTLLSVAAPPVAFSSFGANIDRLAQARKQQ